MKNALATAGSHCCCVPHLHAQQDIPKLGSQLAGILITGQLLRTAKEHGLMQIKERWRAKAVRCVPCCCHVLLWRSDKHTSALVGWLVDCAVEAG